MSTVDIQEFINSENAYFKPILVRAANASEEQRSVWRKETISQRLERISLEVFDMLGGAVRYGPFKGLKLQKTTWWGKCDLGSMLLGLYEKEILDYVDGLMVGECSTFIDIGAADGYYACGLLSSGKVAKAICFEQSDLGQEVIHANWLNNGSKGKLEIYGEANSVSIKALHQQDLESALVLIDIEGYEFELLTDDVLRKLSSCTLVIEIHNWVDNFLTKYEELLVDASQYFQIEVIQRVERPASALAELRDFSDDNRLLITCERRPCLMRFLKLTPNS
jgi:precorrin-6B methylase 2